MEPIDYPSNGTLDDLRRTCIGDEKGFRARLVNLERVEDGAGKKAIRPTYNEVPLNKPFPKRELFFFDITNLSANERQAIRVAQLAQGNALAFSNADRAEVYLKDEEAVVAVYRAP